MAMSRFSDLYAHKQEKKVKVDFPIPTSKEVTQKKKTTSTKDKN